MNEKDIRFENPTKLTLTNMELRSNLLYYNGGSGDGFCELLEPNRMSRLESIDITFESGLLAPLKSDINIIMIVDDIERYYDDVTQDWINSDGSISQSNTLDSLEKEHLLLLLSSESMVRFKLAINYDDNVWIETLNIEFYEEEDTPATQNKCLVYGYLYTPSGDPIINSPINISLDFKRGQYIVGGGALINNDIIIYTDENGYWETTLFPSDAYEQANPMRYILSYGERRDNRKYKLSNKILFEVPDAQTANIKDITI